MAGDTQLPAPESYRQWLTACKTRGAQRQYAEDKNTMAQNNTAQNAASGQLGFEAELFKAADKLRGNMEPSDYKHVVLWSNRLSNSLRGKSVRT